ncbi:hypothetical protein E3N88_18422 [Mikania micrantha]|uniref:Uncharacterized protein n=1 Tax=Mikania micrantha TaxID=192012 RepID=A0A5N6NKC9_9ASTR|nr:hypothetical protein E3N88_18422 [Mikania micrantha]
MQISSKIQALQLKERTILKDLHESSFPSSNQAPKYPRLSSSCSRRLIRVPRFQKTPKNSCHRVPFVEKKKLGFWAEKWSGAYRLAGACEARRCARVKLVGRLWLPGVPPVGGLSYQAVHADVRESENVPTHTAWDQSLARGVPLRAKFFVFFARSTALDFDVRFPSFPLLRDTILHKNNKM